MFKLSSLSVLVLLAAQAIGWGVPVREPIIKRSAPAPPVWVVYSDDFVSGALPPVADVEGFNVFALSFLWDGSAQDQAATWEGLTADQRSTDIASYHAAGIYVIVSAFGSVPLPTTEGEDPTTTAQFMTSWVQEYELDGIDVDYEDLTCFDAGTSCNPEAWLETFTQVLRQGLPQGEYILSHAPLAPWFSPNLWANGGYLAVHESVGSLIDWYNIQFYNQGVTEYTTCAGLLTASSSQWPETAVFQLAANGLTLDKIVIGKPATAADASNGYMDPGTLAGCAQQANEQGWNAGIMTWQYPDATSAWIAEVRADVWPLGGGGPTSISSISQTSTSSTSTSTGSSSGSCAGVPTWSPANVYVANDQVQYDGELYTANQWNEDEVPNGLSGAWVPTAACPAASQGSTIALSQTQAFPPKGTFAYTAVAAQSMPHPTVTFSASTD